MAWGSSSHCRKRSLVHLSSAAALSGEALFVQCQGCHAIEAGEPHKLGPNLHGFFGEALASREGFAYSDALAAAEGKWTRERLRQWLLDPQAMVPGNRMIYSNGMSDAELSALLDYLATTP